VGWHVRAPASGTGPVRGGRIPTIETLFAFSFAAATVVAVGLAAPVER
jgi:hypothetical protein